jgi:hypothetical protein
VLKHWSSNQTDVEGARAIALALAQVSRPDMAVHCRNCLLMIEGPRHGRMLLVMGASSDIGIECYCECVCVGGSGRVRSSVLFVICQPQLVALPVAIQRSL